VFLEYGEDDGFDTFIAVHELHFLLEDIGAKVADILDFLLEVHELEGSGVLEVLDGFVQPEWGCAYMKWKSVMEMRRLGCWLCSLRHLAHPILKALLQVLKRQTNEHFYLCYLHAMPENEPYLPPAFMEFIIIKYEFYNNASPTQQQRMGDKEASMKCREGRDKNSMIHHCSREWYFDSI
jgi:hypothetical protein